METQQTDGEMVNVKFRLRSTKTQKEILRRVSLTDPTIDMIRELIGIWSTSIETMIYIDNEGDGITLETTAEWDECLRLWRENGRCLLRIECTVRKLLSNRCIQELDRRGSVSKKILEAASQSPVAAVPEQRQLSKQECVPDLKLPQMSAGSRPEKVVSEQKVDPVSPHLSEVESPETFSEVVRTDVVNEIERLSSKTNEPPAEDGITSPLSRLVVSPETIHHDAVGDDISEKSHSSLPDLIPTPEEEPPATPLSDITVNDDSQQITITAVDASEASTTIPITETEVSEDTLPASVPPSDRCCEQETVQSPRIEISQEVVHSEAVLPLAGTAEGNLCSASPTPIVTPIQGLSSDADEDTLISIPRPYYEDSKRTKASDLAFDSTVSQKTESLMKGVRETFLETPRSDLQRCGTDATDTASLRLRVQNAEVESSGYTPLVRSINSKDLESDAEDGNASEISFTSTNSFFMCEGEDWQVSSELQETK
eukprot:TRINITY_DN4249_c0_g1_i4.p1 TRINITY_DN4249_c0_g1~~TRINITY_DN4249_c0_g1_i4.p1  ORF type:complete len:485 (+),score=112.74 TRINITY_DN4249_c0_g1_i4:149-1603(+)